MSTNSTPQAGKTRPPRGGRQGKSKTVSPLPPQAEPTPVNDVPAAQSGSRDEHRDHRGVEPRARHMNFIDFLAYVVDSLPRTFNLAVILTVLAILIVAIAVMASHLHFGAFTPVTSDGLTVCLTSVASVVTTLLVRKGRRGGASKHDDGDPPPEHG